MLRRSGFDVRVVAFDRDYHSGRLPEGHVEILAKVQNKKYFLRIVTMISVVPKLRRAMRAVHLVYASGPDMAFAATVAGVGLGRPIVFEVGDIQKAQVATGLVGKIVRMLDRYVSNVAKLIVATAPGYIDGYYRKWLGCRTRAMVIENKLEVSAGVRDRVEVGEEGGVSGDHVLRIGFFGLLRCAWAWNVLESLANTYRHNVQIVVAGRPVIPADIGDRAARLPNVEFLGEYRSPLDLPVLYGKVDIVWAAYPFPSDGELNWQWARTNRFYESCKFKRPMITLAGSADAVEVDRLEIGMSVSGNDIGSIVEKVASSVPEKLGFWRSKIEALPRELYEYTREESILANELAEIIGAGDVRISAETNAND